MTNCTEYKPKKESLEDLERKLKRKESQAIDYREKGMNIAYGLLMEEINILKSTIKKLQMGSK